MKNQIRQAHAALLPMARSKSLLEHITKSVTLSAETFGSGLVLLSKGCMALVYLFQQSRECGSLSSRQDVRMVSRVKSDLKRLIPATLALSVPLHWSSSYLLKHFPYFLPSSFVTGDLFAKKITIGDEKRVDLSEKLSEAMNNFVKKQENANNIDPVMVKKWIKMARFFDTPLTPQNDAKTPDNVIYDFNLFQKDLNLFNLSYPLSVQCARFVGLGFPQIAPRARLLQWIDWILKDDALIRKEGVKSLSTHELLEALDERGLFHFSDASMTQCRNILSTHLAQTEQLMQLCQTKTSESRYILNRGAILGAVMAIRSQSK